jgi:hypothetical protein
MLPITTRKITAFAGEGSSLNEKLSSPVKYENMCQNLTQM